MRSRSSSNIFALLFLFINISYLGVLWFSPDIYLHVMQSNLMPLTKLWLVNLIGFIGFDLFRIFIFLKPIYFIVLLLCANITAFIGLFLNKNWGRRAFIYILLAMCIWGFFWPRISTRSTDAMETYMHRAYNAWIYNHYWQPLKEEYGVVPLPQAKQTNCSDKGNCNCASSSKNVMQYEPALYPLPKSYKESKDALLAKFSNPEKEANTLAPAYWGIYRVGDDAFETSKELYQLLLFLVRILFYTWFIIIPTTFLFILYTKKKEPALLEGTPKMESSNPPKESVSDVIMENVISGAIIIVIQNLWGLSSGLFAIALVICLCHIGHTLSTRSTLKYPQYFWLYGLCYISTPLIFSLLGLINSRYTSHYAIAWKFSTFLVIYFFCFMGGLKGRKFIQDGQRNNISSEIKLVGALLFLYPLFVFLWSLALTEGKISFGNTAWLQWIGFFVLYGILGYGVLRLNWKIRLAAIIFSVAGIAGPLLGIVIAPFINFDLFLKVLKMHGSTVVIWQPLLIFFNIFGVSLIYLGFIVYKLCRPEIKEQFRKKD